MTSGNFHSLAIDTINVSREHRQRRALTGIPELADSIQALGLIHPIVVRRDSLELIAGERRLAAVRALGYTHITAQYQDELDPYLLKRLELEENTRRVDIPWQDQCRAIDEYNKLRLAQDPGWTQVKTAEALGLSTAEVSDKIAVAKEIVSNPVLAKADKFSIANNFTKRANDRRSSNVLASLASETKSDSILNQSFFDWAPLYAGPKFNFIHCDFPYGINAEKIQQGYKRLEHGEYEDTFENYENLLNVFKSSLDNFAAESCHLMFWFSMKHYAFTKIFLETCGFSITPWPLIWYKSDSKGIAPDVNRLPRNVYETAFFGARGDRKIVRLVDNAIAHATTSDIHMSEKPVGMLQHFFRMIVDNTTQILDPTCGSGSALRAAEIAGANKVLGLEINPEFHRRAVDLLEGQRKKEKVA